MMQNGGNAYLISHRSEVDDVGKPPHKHGAILTPPLCETVRLPAYASDGIVDCFEELTVEADLLAPIPSHPLLDVTLSGS